MDMWRMTESMSFLFITNLGAHRLSSNELASGDNRQHFRASSVARTFTVNRYLGHDFHHTVVRSC